MCTMCHIGSDVRIPVLTPPVIGVGSHLPPTVLHLTTVRRKPSA